MAEARVERRLSAILAADVAGYSRLMGSDEEDTLARLKAHRLVLIDPKITEHRGRIANTAGDGMIVEFASVVDALRCAIDIQLGMAERNADLPKEKRIDFRIGINVGDVMIDGTDLAGDGVNIAARLESIADSGGISVSSRVQEDSLGKLNVAFEDAGEQQLKNIARPVRVFRVRLNDEVAKSQSSKMLSPPEKPSIAVLPFQNMSGDPEQEYFADGIVEDIITALSHIKILFVIARNSSFTYKGKSVDIKRAGRELGVRYVLEGSVRKSANRVRITAQLIDSETGAHIWAERFDGPLEDVFELQDRVTSSVIGAIAPKLEQVEIERAKRKATENLDAYDYYLRGMASFYLPEKRDNDEALRCFYKAIELDSDFGAAYAFAAACHVARKSNDWMDDVEKETAETKRLTQIALALGKDDATALSACGMALAFVMHDLDGATMLIDRALVLNPNLATNWVRSSWIRIWRGEPKLATEHAAMAMRLSPIDPLIGGMQTAMAFGHLLLDQYDEAISWAQKALREQPTFLAAMRVLAASSALAGRMEEAEKVVARLREIAPNETILELGKRFPFSRPQDAAKMNEGLHKAGLPD